MIVNPILSNNFFILSFGKIATIHYKFMLIRRRDFVIKSKTKIGMYKWWPPLRHILKMEFLPKCPFQKNFRGKLCTNGFLDKKYFHQHLFVRETRFSSGQLDKHQKHVITGKYESFAEWKYFHIEHKQSN